MLGQGKLGYKFRSISLLDVEQVLLLGDSDLQRLIRGTDINNECAITMIDLWLRQNQQLDF